MVAVTHEIIRIVSGAESLRWYQRSLSKQMMNDRRYKLSGMTSMIETTAMSWLR